MSPKNEREYKIANQRRKLEMLARNKKPVGVPIHVIQNGKHTAK